MDPRKMIFEAEQAFIVTHFTQRPSTHKNSTAKKSNQIRMSDIIKTCNNENTVEKVSQYQLTASLKK